MKVQTFDSLNRGCSADTAETIGQCDIVDVFLDCRNPAWLQFFYGLRAWRFTLRNDSICYKEPNRVYLFYVKR
jgi:hypothetical protein